ncbi:unnamed protein product, partial [Ascophyllum nodosum]
MAAPAHAILLKVTVVRAQHLKSVSTISTQDPYVRAKLLVDGYHTAEGRTAVHNNGGRNPDWTGRRNVITLQVPPSVPLSRLAVVLEIHDENVVQDKMIGTCGQIPLERVADGNKRQWGVSPSGELMASFSFEGQPP